jgi:hypothetical protein
VRGHLVRGMIQEAADGAGADPKVVQRVLGHATAAMTMDLYGHMMDANLWQAARLVGDISGTFAPPEAGIENEDGQEPRLIAW